MRRTSSSARHAERGVHLQSDAEFQSAFARCEGVIITQGFIARNAAGETVLLDAAARHFGGLLAAKLQAKRCEIWTDVPGMFTADPSPPRGSCARSTTTRPRRSPPWARRSSTHAPFRRAATGGHRSASLYAETELEGRSSAGGRRRWRRVRPPMRRGGILVSG